MSKLSHAAQRLLANIEAHTATVGVIGLGYVGLPLSLVFTRAGFPVIGFDIDTEKTQKLERNESYIRHIGSSAVAEARGRGFRATSDFDRLRKCDAILICVPTPLNEQREPDLSFIENTGREIAKRLRAGQLIVLESSTFPGTTEEVLLPLLEASGIPCSSASARALAESSAAISSPQHAAAAAASSPGNVGEGLQTATLEDTFTVQLPRAFVAFSPEREDPGNKRFTTAAIPKLVGGVDAEAGALAAALYSGACERVVPVSSAAVAEMAKILENTYRCVNIALVNELKQLCMRMGIDICEVIDAAATKPFGFQPFYPGPGLGGHCIPIDPFYLSWKARQYDFTTRFIELAGEINTEMPYKVVEYTADVLNNTGKAVRGSRILILGIAYKKDIDDLRESPALKIIELLRRRGAVIEYNDPHLPHLHKGRNRPWEMFSVPFEPVDAAKYDVVIIVTDHSAYDYAAIAKHARVLIDTRNATRGLNGGNIHRC